MIRKTIKTTSLIIIFGFTAYLLWQKSPLCSSYYFNKGKQLYDVRKYDGSVKLFQRSLEADPNNSASRYFLVLALSKGTPAYSKQKELYDIANSKIHDAAQSYAGTQIISLKQKLLEGMEDNYIYSAILNKDVLRWNTELFPLKVYFGQNADTPSYYRDNIKAALEEWEKRSNFIKFTEVYKPEDCDIYIKFSAYEGMPCTGSNCVFTLATTSNTTDKNNNLTKMIIKFYNTDPSGKSFSQTDVYNTALHEIGHALGIIGHSDNPDDVMYSNNHEKTNFGVLYNGGKMLLSLRDLNTLALLYRLAPNITNKEPKYIENLYYPPIILGNEEEILEKKLKEYRAYVVQYPNYAGGYINLAAVYSEIGNDALAEELLDKAETLATNDDERFLIKYNKANLSYNNQDFKTALKYAQEAKQIKDDKNTEAFINEINLMLKNSK